eukprot:9495313-Pyramimonas_sp.AAC.1
MTTTTSHPDHCGLVLSVWVLVEPSPNSFGISGTVVCHLFVLERLVGAVLDDSANERKLPQTRLVVSGSSWSPPGPSGHVGHLEVFKANQRRNGEKVTPADVRDQVGFPGPPLQPSEEI